MTDRVLRLALGRAAALVVCAWVAVGAVGCPQPENAEGAAVTIRNQLVTVDLRKTPAEQALGLGDRDLLAWDHGMLFLYDKSDFLVFWMKGMRFDIDIVWIREQRIVGMAEFVPYPREDPSKPATVRSPELVDMVLEVPAGYARAHAWRRGDRVELAGVPGQSGTGN